MGARLFTAVVPPPEVVGDLDAFCTPRREAEPRLRWTPPEHWHLTTSFLPDVDPGHLDRLVEALADVAERTPPLRLSVVGGGCFPEPRRAKVLFAAIAGDTEELGALARRARNAAVRAGATVDGTRFRPHLTLGRSGRGLDATRLLRVLDAYASPAWTATEHVLIASHLRDRGARYEVLERFALAGGRDAGEATGGPRLG